MLSLLLTVIVVVAIVGFVLWMVVTYVPMPPPFKTALVGISCLVLLLWVVRWLLVTGPLLRGL